MSINSGKSLKKKSSLKTSVFSNLSLKWKNINIVKYIYFKIFVIFFYCIIKFIVFCKWYVFKYTQRLWEIYISISIISIIYILYILNN
jgi:hypothetical protein